MTTSPNAQPPAIHPLDGVTVIDLTSALAGPFATLLLAGLGARVIKVENPAAGDTSRTNAPYLGREGVKLIRDAADDMSLSHITRSRGKLAVTLNLKHPRGREVFADLVRQADVVVENFSRGTVDKLGVGYQFARGINPRIIYCSISGFGQAGEAGGGKALDPIIQALGGIMLAMGGPDDPPIRVGIPFADVMAGIFGTMGVLAAREQVHRTGEGQHVDVAMLGAVASLLAVEPYDALQKLGVPIRTGPTLPRLAPFGAYRARDGWLTIAAPLDQFARGLWQALGQPELGQDPRFATRDARVQHTDELDAIITAWTRHHTVAEAVACLDAAGVPAAPVRSPVEAINDPLVVARGETLPLEHPTYGHVDDVRGTGIPIQFSASSTGFDLPAPRLGENNELIYGDLLGYAPEQIAELRREGVI